MKKIETWEDLKEAFKDNENISFEEIKIKEDCGYFHKTEIINYGECILLNDDIAFDKKGQLLISDYNLLLEISTWRKEDINNRTYQQIHDIIKLMLE